jgi:hypothetical protein
MHLTSDIRRAWTEGGAKTVLTRGLRRVVRPAIKVGSLVFIECDLRRPMPERREISGLTVREATPGDAFMFADPDLLLERLNRGHRCFMGIEEATGKLTNYRWICSGSADIPELRRHMLLKPGEAYAYDLNTLPEFRRRGIDAYTRHWIYSHLRDTGYTRVYAYIHGDNHPSLKASRILLQPVGRVFYLQVRDWTPFMFAWRKRGFPELCF